MPTYEYACKSCGRHLEVQQSFTDDALTACPSCGGPLRKVFGNISISFKGSGFYSTDNRLVGKAGGTKSDSDGGGTSPEGAKADSSSAAEGSKSESSSTKAESSKSESTKSDSPAAKPGSGGSESSGSNSSGSNSGGSKSGEKSAAAAS